MTKKIVKLGSVPIQSGTTRSTRMAIMLWGPATVGKTTWAATAPGDKLWLSFGDNEHVSVMHRKDVRYADLSAQSLDSLFTQAQSDNPFGLEEVLSEDEDIGTVVVDSITALTFRALQRAVKNGVGASKSFRPTMEFPGQSAYGGRNGIVLEVVTGILRVTAKYGVHCIINAHEADPTNKKEGGNEIIDYIGVMLGGQLVNNMSSRLSEIWYMGKESYGEQSRFIAFRPTRMRKPMKTRMFTDMDKPEFKLPYNAHKPDKGQLTIARIYEQWVDGGYEKLPVPGSKGKDK